MNIFYLDRDPIRAAQYACDKHVVKMILESSQLLSAAVILNGGTAPYKLTHQNHPSAVWTRKTRSNYYWLCSHLQGLLQEYTNRYGKIHSCHKHLDFFFNQAALIPAGEFTDPPQCMPDNCKTTDTVLAYRNYYNNEKAYFAKWRTGNIPEWWAC